MRLLLLLLFLTGCATTQQCPAPKTVKKYKPKYEKEDCVQFVQEKLKKGMYTEGIPMEIVRVLKDKYKVRFQYKGMGPVYFNISHKTMDDLTKRVKCTWRMILL